MRKLLTICCSVALVFALAVTAAAHPGRTDSSGGHWNRSTGEYHYHHGMPEHMHEDTDNDGDLDCPYDDSIGGKVKESQSNSSGSAGGTSGSSNFTQQYSSAKKSSSSSSYSTYTPKPSSSYTSTYTPSSTTTAKTTKTITQEEHEAQIGGLLFFAIFVCIFCLIILGCHQASEKETALILQRREYEQKLKSADSLILEAKDTIRSMEQQLARKDAEKRSELLTLKHMITTDVSLHCLDFHTKLKAHYGERYMYDMAGAPNDAYLDINYLPHTIGSSSGTRIDKYTFYIARTASARPRYHSSSCRYADYGIAINAYTLQQSEIYVKCSFCNPELPNMQWVDTLKELYVFLKKYDSIDSTPKALHSQAIRYSLRDPYQ